MVIVYVKLGTDNAKPYALLLPEALPPFDWREVDVRPSALHGNGVFPSDASAVGKRKRDWEGAHNIPILLPYFGHETVIHDNHELDMMLKVLKGDFEVVMLGELQREHGMHEYVADGLFAVRKDADESSKPSLPPSVRLLQLQWSSTSTDACCYLIADDVRADLGLVGERAHLFERLCSRGDTINLATHIAVVRRDEGIAIINAHPAFKDPLAVVGLINEPAAQQQASLVMRHGYVQLLRDDDPLMLSHDLTQPAGATASWQQHIQLIDSDRRECGISEKMVLYETRRIAYAADAELTVDYGPAYVRDYSSGVHKPANGHGAMSPAEVTHAFTLKSGRLSFAVLTGKKRVENRDFRIQPGWYALHTGASSEPMDSQKPLLACVQGMPAGAAARAAAARAAARAAAVARARSR